MPARVSSLSSSQPGRETLMMKLTSRGQRYSDVAQRQLPKVVCFRGERKLMQNFSADNSHRLMSRKRQDGNRPAISSSQTPLAVLILSSSLEQHNALSAFLRRPEISYRSLRF